MPPTAPTQPVTPQPASGAIPWSQEGATRRLAVQQLLKVLGAGLGLGALGRGALGLADYVSKPPIDPLMYTSSVPTPLPVVVHKKRRQPAQTAAATKAAQQGAAVGPLPGPRTLPNDTIQALASRLPWSPANPQEPLGDTWGIPAAVGAGIGGVYGGAKLIDWLLQKQRKGDIANQVDEAKREYQQALIDQYRSAMQGKQAEDTLGIDDLYRMTKQGLLGGVGDAASKIHNTMMWPWRAMLGPAAVEKYQGLLAAANLIAGTGAGVATYNWVKDKNKQKLLEKAVRMRARQRQFSPTPFYARPEIQEVSE